MLKKQTTAHHLIFILIIYILCFISTCLIPFSILFSVFIISLKNEKLALRIGIIGLVCLINNQFVLAYLNTLVYGGLNFVTYQAGLLFYYCFFLLYRNFIFQKYTKPFIFFFIQISLLLILNFLELPKAILFMFNVLGGFLVFYTIINYIDLPSNNKFYSLLKKDFTYVIITILMLSSIIFIFDLCTDNTYYKFHANAFGFIRGGPDYSTVLGVPNGYTTVIKNHLIFRYSPLLNGPIRASYWSASFVLFSMVFIKDKILKSILIIFSLALMFLSFSKGGFLFLILVLFFYLLQNKKLYTLSFISFIILMSIFIYISQVTKTSAMVHVQGLKLPFEQKFGLNYIFGNGMHKAGNMGGVEGEFWLKRIQRGAESLVGTYFYAFGIFGIFLYFWIHMISIIKMNKRNLFFPSAMIMSLLFVSFLQENVYNIFQITPFLFLMFFYLGKFNKKQSV